MDFIKKTIKLGNSCGVILPKKLLGSEVKITVVNRPLNIKKEVMELISSNLPDILGIYIINKEPAEVIAVSTNIRKIITTKKLKISFVPFSLIKKDIKTNSSLREKISKAETILNQFLINELKKT